MNSAALINVSQGIISGIQQSVVDARELHGYLQNRDLFANWIRSRIEKFGFLENQDYAIALEITKAKRGGHNRMDYRLSLDMAKELCMVENNEQGRLARRYFIECERQALASAPGVTLLQPSSADLLRYAQGLTLPEISRVTGLDVSDIIQRLHQPGMRMVRPAHTPSYTDYAQVLERFWTRVLSLPMDQINHSAKPRLTLAINLPQVYRLIGDDRLPDRSEVREALPYSVQPRFQSRNVSIRSRLTLRTARCWMFEAVRPEDQHLLDFDPEDFKP